LVSANRLLIRMAHHLNNVYVVFFGNRQNASKYWSIQSISKRGRKLGATALEEKPISLSQIDDGRPLVPRLDATLAKASLQDVWELVRRNVSNRLGIIQRFVGTYTLAL
jgi:hypothetical protein